VSLERDGRTDIGGYRKGVHVKTEIEIGVMLSQAKEYQESPAAGRGKILP